MKILGLDSSGLVASVAIVEDNDLKGEYTVNYKKTHSQTLLPMLDEVAKMIRIGTLNSVELPFASFRMIRLLLTGLSVSVLPQAKGLGTGAWETVDPHPYSGCSCIQSRR